MAFRTRGPSTSSTIRSIPTTGSITVRGVFANPELKGGHRLLVARSGSRKSACRSGYPTVRSWSLIGPLRRTSEGRKYVYVLDSENKVQTRRITTGALQEDGLRVIEEGLKPDDWVVSGGILQVRARMQITPDRVPMPTLGQPGAAAPAPAVPKTPDSPRPQKADDRKGRRP